MSTTRFEFPGAPPAAVFQVATPSLGDHSYVAVVGDLAVVIDPQRDIERFVEVAAAAGARITAVFETHIHNDYVSGGAVLAARHDADYVLPAGSGASIGHLSLADGDEYPLGSWRLQAIHTPGHTPHHTSYALVGTDGPAAVFTGGSMLVGAVGRSDLLGPELTDTLLRDQFRSVRRLASGLPDPTRVGPTHGAGSFCSASEVAETTTTIGLERRRNPALLAPDVETFARGQKDGYRLFPAYYAHMGPVNLAGAEPVPESPLPHLDPDGIAAAIEEGMPVVDLRPTEIWAAGHVPGSINVAFSDEVATYLGWIFPWNTPVVLLADDPAHVEAVRLQLARIGHDAVAGMVVPAVAAWSADGRPLTRTRVVRFADLLAEQPAVRLDVRDPKEVEAEGAVAGARNVHVSRLKETPLPPGDPIWVSCGAGYRAAIAAGLLEQQGREAVVVLDEFERYRVAV